MEKLRYLVAALATIQGGYMLLDGLRALLTGSYITPSSGAHAGQLGPWVHLVAAVGLRPDQTAVKASFVIIGSLWLLAAVAVALAAPWSLAVTITMAVATLWYLIPGTIISIVVIVLLLLAQARGSL